MAAILDVRGLPEVKKMLGEFTDRQLVNRTRRALRGAGGVYRKRMRSAGQMGWPRRPRSFSKTRTRNHQNPLGVSISPQSPLSNVFEGGGKAHAIGGTGQVLSNFGNRREGGADFSGGFFAARGPVRHPGVEARPFIAPIFDAGENEAREQFAEDLFEGVR